MEDIKNLYLIYLTINRFFLYFSSLFTIYLGYRLMMPEIINNKSCGNITNIQGVVGDNSFKIQTSAQGIIFSLVGGVILIYSVISSPPGIDVKSSYNQKEMSTNTSYRGDEPIGVMLEKANSCFGRNDYNTAKKDYMDAFCSVSKHIGNMAEIYFKESDCESANTVNRFALLLDKKNPDYKYVQQLLNEKCNQ